MSSPETESKPPEPRIAYRDRPSDDGKHGDGAADPSGIEEDGKEAESILEDQ
jgi:hypothetical protein